ncbi:transcriptional regulator [Thermobispora bispora]|jgi:transcriptional regulator with XRE-family HTH domain|uniref:Helix-turn-helix domain protein n=1 Tax=Thermobispora bispora (strain ATCC 19993 / DSM 43833 / CBS 139.67 / JCM 10125 / KCTC 9307 / NBRC 14880 / R51) TaxID=469371 RepID=D6Y305_THEBD|nr:helix-turn-helix transcriptional regulator [Thermobispora bispora]ADG86966.1 helix-turn-helix domain protein [Thermobispora bispora DSM 43833]MBO2474487.1 XRE family transcriptional regulator [Actinomycetales bacterium]MBX6168568.1 helix-turn-helix domain-containing protein [Thermobispora bispora]MDI9580138.1 helix-turn-helix transcriptional regulator [Thermobispora sp.]
MPDRSSPTVRRRRLGQELRRLREQAELTGDQVAARLGWSAAKLSRIETARTVPRRSDVEALLMIYMVDSEQRHELLALHRDASRKGWWEKYRDTLPEEYTTFLGLEAEATVARHWEPQIVPGLFQTEAYVHALMESSQRSTLQAPGDLRDRIQVRMARQEAILSAERPQTLSVVVEESVLLRRFGDSAVMREQLQRLIEVSELPNVDLRVLPLDADHCINTGAFIHLTLPEYHDVVYLEALLGGRLLEDEQIVYRYEVAFDYLKGRALDADASRKLIAKTIGRWK